MIAASSALRATIAFVAVCAIVAGCTDEQRVSEPARTLQLPITGALSVVTDVLNAWPTPSTVVEMSPPTFIYYGTQLLYRDLEVAPGVFRRVEFTFRGNDSTDVYTLYRFRVYVENARTKPIVLSDSPLSLIDGVEAGMLMSGISAILGPPDEYSQDATVAHWTYRLPGMTCQLDMVPDIEAVWRVFNLEFVMEWNSGG